MRELKSLREDWAERELATAQVASGLTISEKVEFFFALYDTFASRLEETTTLFGPQRQNYLAEFQQRLSVLATWQQTQHND